MIKALSVSLEFEFKVQKFFKLRIEEWQFLKLFMVALQSIKMK